MGHDHGHSASSTASTAVGEVSFFLKCFEFDFDF